MFGKLNFVSQMYQLKFISNEKSVYAQRKWIGIYPTLTISLCNCWKCYLKYHIWILIEICQHIGELSGARKLERFKTWSLCISIIENVGTCAIRKPNAKTVSNFSMRRYISTLRERKTHQQKSSTTIYVYTLVNSLSAVQTCSDISQLVDDQFRTLTLY